ncbi:hypothetical protein ACHAPT_013487 [Fusarium lateritium]
MIHHVHNEKTPEGQPVNLRIAQADDIAGIHRRFHIRWTYDNLLDLNPQASWEDGVFVERDVQHTSEKKVLDY